MKQIIMTSNIEETKSGKETKLIDAITISNESDIEVLINKTLMNCVLSIIHFLDVEESKKYQYKLNKIIEIINMKEK